VDYINWRYEKVSEKTPDEVLIEDLGITLAEYHLRNGATPQEVQNSRVVYVKKSKGWNQGYFILIEGTIW